MCMREKETGKKGKHGQGVKVEVLGNEPWSEVKSKVEAHLLQSDDSKTNEAQRGSLKKSQYSFCANQELAH